MTYVVMSPCIEVKDGACVEVCPVDCIYEGGHMMYIQPDECIDCGICESVCPVQAIAPVTRVPPDEHDFIAVNRQFFDNWISGLGAPASAETVGALTVDHPIVVERLRA